MVYSRTKLFLESNFKIKVMDETNIILGVRVLRKGDIYYYPRNNVLQNFLESLTIVTLSQ